MFADRGEEEQQANVLGELMMSILAFVQDLDPLYPRTVETGSWLVFWLA